MRKWTGDEVLKATGGTGPGDWVAEGVSIDSRTVERGNLFIALAGEHFDGHAYVASALEQGAEAALVNAIPEGVDARRCIIVSDTEEALQKLGIFSRTHTQARIIGVTGSVGKTGCKEMLKASLTQDYSVYATKGNLNNHLGVPLSLANMPANTEIAIFEMGMNHAGEITKLTEWVRPDIAIITTIEAAHAEFFDSIEAIADAKAEIFTGMGGQGVAILNADNAQYERLKRKAVARGLDRVLSFGTGTQLHCRMLDYRFTETGSEVEADIAGTPIHYHLGTIGSHWALMSVAVLAAIDALGLDLARAAAALAHFREPEGRGNIAKLRIKGGHLRLIDDSYNASPASMEAAFEKLYALKLAERGECRTVAVLGDMLELGEEAKSLHLALVPALINNQLDLVFAAGRFMQDLYYSLPETMQGDYDPTAAGLAPKVVKKLKDRDIVLVKGSHGSKMHSVVKAIKENAEQ